LGNTAIQLGNTVTTLNNMTLANVTISSGNVTITNVSVTTANVTTLNATTVIATTANVTTANITTGNVTNMTSGNVTITGGSINGTTLGATTASTANVTTLTTSSTVTINGGTANGVAYLDGSKVLTTGSALTFDGTNLKIGNPTYAPNTNLSGNLLQIKSSSGFSYLTMGNGDGVNNNTYIGSASSITTFGTVTDAGATTELMRLTSTGLGIGTSSPAQKLHVQGRTQLGTAGVSGQYALTFVPDTAGNSFVSLLNDTGRLLFIQGGNPYAGSTLMTLDQSGNLGIGTSSPAGKLHVSGQTRIADSANAANYILIGAGANAPRGGNALTAQTGSLVFATESANPMIFVTNAVEAARLDSSGNLGIGTSSPAYKLDVDSTAGTVVSLNSTNANGPGLRFTRSGTANGYVGSAKYIVGGALADFGIDVSGANNLIFGTNDVERARIDSSGNLGLGVQPSAWSTGALQIRNASFWGASSSPTFASVGSNYFFSDTYRYISAAAAADYYQFLGQHVWRTAPSWDGTGSNAISFTQALTLDANRNLLLNGTTAGASSVGTLTIFNGTAPTGSVTDGVILFAADVSASSELRVRDEAGNVTTLSPHNFELIPEGPSEDMAWAYYSEKNGKKINVDMLKLARMVEKLTGEKLVYES
jgi:hypothetical protein